MVFLGGSVRSSKFGEFVFFSLGVARSECSAHEQRAYSNWICRSRVDGIHLDAAVDGAPGG